MKIKNDHKKYLISDRLRNSSVRDRNIVTEAESDRGRLLFSPPFRRLQQKAQVFSMEPNAAVRSRLTHSLEVSQVGRYIADVITQNLLTKEMLDKEHASAFVIFVENACLMHDIGNPPFGHFGEAAIQKWFRKKGASLFAEATGVTAPNNAHPYLNDFYEFDGNPQGLRIATRLQWNSDNKGLNLTKSTLGAYLKYLRCGDEKKNVKKFQKKIGFFSTEKQIIHDVWNTFGVKQKNPRRLPLTYIMEASDDIAYCISDLEDSIEKGLINKQDAFAEIKSNWKNKKDKEQNKNLSSFLKSLNAETTFIDFRTRLNRMLVIFAAEEYTKNLDSIFSGKADSLLNDKNWAGQILDILKDYCKDHVYGHESVHRTELAGYTAIFGLLNHFEELLACKASRFQAALENKTKDEEEISIVTERKYLNLFPEKHILVYKDHVKKLKDIKDIAERNSLEWNYRAHLIVDFISGMTDDYSMSTYRTLSGMKL